MSTSGGSRSTRSTRAKKTEPPAHKPWYQAKETILLYAGLAIILVELIASATGLLTFHREFILLGAALCGVGATQWLDHGNRQ